MAVTFFFARNHFHQDTPNEAQIRLLFLFFPPFFRSRLVTRLCCISLFFLLADLQNVLNFRKKRPSPSESDLGKGEGGRGAKLGGPTSRIKTIYLVTYS